MTSRSLRLVGRCFLVALAIAFAHSVSAGEALAPEEYFKQGLSAFQRGAFEEAVVSWTDAARSYERDHKPGGQIAVLIHLSQAYSAIGQYKQAIRSLESALELARKLGDPARIASVLAGLGGVYIATGPPETAEAYLKHSLSVARGLEDSTLEAVILNNFGNLFATQKKYTDAVAAYRDSIVLAKRSSHRSLSARSMSNAAVALRQNGEPQESKALLDAARDELQKADPSHETAFALITIGLAYRDLLQFLADSR